MAQHEVEHAHRTVVHQPVATVREAASDGRVVHRAVGADLIVEAALVDVDRHDQPVRRLEARPHDLGVDDRLGDPCGCPTPGAPAGRARGFRQGGSTPDRRRCASRPAARRRCSCICSRPCHWRAARFATSRSSFASVPAESSGRASQRARSATGSARGVVRWACRARRTGNRTRRRPDRSPPTDPCGGRSRGAG